MNGIGPPLVTPFDRDGDVDHDRLESLVHWVEARGVDFIVPCGSNSEAELMTAEERTSVIETVCEAASVPVLAGTGSPGFRETRLATEAAADVGADAALVVTPFYYSHGQETHAAYFRDIAEASPIPVYLYSVPAYTDVRLEPETVADLATHPNIVGMKDSHASIAEFIRTERRVHDRLEDSDSFDLMIGSGSVLAQALDVGATGGVLALANLAPSELVGVYKTHRQDPSAARDRNAALVEMNTAITSMYGVPGLKWAMRERGAAAGYPRSPHQEPDEHARGHLLSLLDEL